MLKLKKKEEGIFEFALNIFMPIWLPIKAIQIMLKEIKEEKKKREEEEKK
ncbi:hypothetical protein K0B03_02025 [Patescibacteria group bacterium]|nr:hypothetical protein [Patescibacteria group bacterium]